MVSDDIFSQFDTHAWNILVVEGNNYLIDVTFGSGTCNGNTYEIILKEFYFCAEPEYLIFTHFPKDSKWQLLKNPLNNDEFTKLARFNYLFFEYFRGSSKLNYVINKKEGIIRLYKKNLIVK